MKAGNEQRRSRCRTGRGRWQVRELFRQALQRNRGAVGQVFGLTRPEKSVTAQEAESAEDSVFHAPLRMIAASPT